LKATIDVNILRLLLHYLNTSRPVN